MENIKASIKYWLQYCSRIDGLDPNWNWFTYYGFIKEYEQHYLDNSEESGNTITEDDIKSAALSPKGFFTSAEVLSDCIYLKYSENKYMEYAKDMIVGYEIRIKGSELIFDLLINLNDGKNEIIKIPVNDILNEYLNENRFTRGLIINDRDVLKNILRTMFAGCAQLSHYIDKFSCPGYFSFLTKTDFLDEYEKMNLGCHRCKECKNIADNKTVMSILKQYDGVKIKSFAGERLYRVIKQAGDTEILYEASIKCGNLLILRLCGVQGEKRLFGAPDIESVIKDIKGTKLFSLEFQSVEELRNMLDFMQRYLIILAGFFGGST